MTRRLAVLGATGSVGRAALEVALRDGREVAALAAGSDAAALAELCRIHRPELAALADEEAAEELRRLLGPSPTRVLGGAQGVAEAAASGADDVIAAVAGVAGVEATIAAARAGRRVLLANKESLVVAGPRLLEICRAAGGELIPVDSEHSALLELLEMARGRGMDAGRVWLTASGGPFRELADLSGVSPEMALAHPVWEMGPKITIDSATLMNKGLEVIEACYLFGLPPERVEVAIHPQAIVHAIVELADGSSVAHCGPPDMRAAVARALAWPEPAECSFGSLDWHTLGSLEFGPPDLDRFPCLRLAREALAAGGAAPAVLNAANEVAVGAFANGSRLRFVDIPAVIERTLERSPDLPGASIDDLLAADGEARRMARGIVAEIGGARPRRG